MLLDLFFLVAILISLRCNGYNQRQVVRSSCEESPCCYGSSCHQVLAPRVYNRGPDADIICRSRALTAHFTHSSILGLNAILLEAPRLLLENFASETPSVIYQGISNSDVG